MSRRARRAGAAVRTMVAIAVCALTVGAIGGFASAANADVTIELTPTTLPNATVGSPYAQTIIASGGAEPYQFDVISGMLPPGLSLSPEGSLTGTPTAPDAYNFTIEAVDANSVMGNRAYTMRVDLPPVVVSPATLPHAVVGVPYSQTLTAAGGVGDGALGAYTFLVGAGTLPNDLPAGLSLDSTTGILSGTPTTAGSSTFGVQATDNASGSFGTRIYTLTVDPVAGWVPPPVALAGATVGVAYSQTLPSLGDIGSPPFSVTSGSLPPGLALDAKSGVLSGTPTSAGSFAFEISAYDAEGNPGSQSYTLEVAAAATAASSSSSASLAAATSTGSSLAATGTDSRGLLGIAVLLLLAGTGLLVGGRALRRSGNHGG